MSRLNEWTLHESPITDAAGTRCEYSLEACPNDRYTYPRLFGSPSRDMACVWYIILVCTKLRYYDEIHKICDSHTDFIFWKFYTPFFRARQIDSLLHNPFFLLLFSSVSVKNSVRLFFNRVSANNSPKSTKRYQGTVRTYVRTYVINVSKQDVQWKERS